MNEDDNTTDIRQSYDGRPEKFKEGLPNCPGSPKPSESQVFRGARPKDTTCRRVPPSSSTSCKAPASKIRKTCSDPASMRYTIHGTCNCEYKEKKHVSPVMSLTYGFNANGTRATKDPLKFLTFDDNISSLKRPMIYLPGKTSIHKTLASAYRNENNRHFPLQNHAMNSLFVEAGEPGFENIDKCSRIQSKKNKEVIDLMRYISSMEDQQDSGQNSPSKVENTEDPEEFMGENIENPEEFLGENIENPEEFLDENIENRKESGDKYIDGREESDVENFQNRTEFDKNVENREDSENINIKNREESDDRNIENRDESDDENIENREESDDRNIEISEVSVDKNYVELDQCIAHQTNYRCEELDSWKEEDINLKNREEYAIGNIGEYTVVNSIIPALENHSEPTAETDVQPINENLRSSAYENFSIDSLESLSEPSSNKLGKGNDLKIPKGLVHKNCKETIHNSFLNFRRPVLLGPLNRVHRDMCSLLLINTSSKPNAPILRQSYPNLIEKIASQDFKVRKIERLSS